MTLRRFISFSTLLGSDGDPTTAAMLRFLRRYDRKTGDRHQLNSPIVY